MSRRVALAALFVAWCAAVAWMGWLGFRWWRGPVGGGLPGRDGVLRHSYPQLWSSGLLGGDTPPDEPTFDILLLGASVLEQAAPQFARRAADATGRPTRVYNLAVSAHTSRDSRFKHERVRDLPLDLVVWYDGINDVRMNCCPPGAFRDDYRHCAWYDGLERRLEAGRINLLDVVKEGLDRRIGLGEPEPEWIDQGAELKTPAAYRANVESVLRDCAARKRPVALVTFALHLPDDYDRAAYLRGDLDYGAGHYRLPAEVWGRPQHLAAGVRAHNDALRELASQHDDAILIDLAAEFPRDGVHFSDPCHLTEAGVAKWNEIVLAALSAALRR